MFHPIRGFRVLSSSRYQNTLHQRKEFFDKPHVQPPSVERQNIVILLRSGQILLPNAVLTTAWDGHAMPNQDNSIRKLASSRNSSGLFRTGKLGYILNGSKKKEHTFILKERSNARKPFWPDFMNIYEEGSTCKNRITSVVSFLITMSKLQNFILWRSCQTARRGSQICEQVFHH